LLNFENWTAKIEILLIIGGWQSNLFLFILPIFRECLP